MQCYFMNLVARAKGLASHNFRESAISALTSCLVSGSTSVAANTVGVIALAKTTIVRFSKCAKALDFDEDQFTQYCAALHASVTL